MDRQGLLGRSTGPCFWSEICWEAKRERHGGDGCLRVASRMTHSHQGTESRHPLSLAPPNLCTTPHTPWRPPYPVFTTERKKVAACSFSSAATRTRARRRFCGFTCNPKPWSWVSQRRLQQALSKWRASPGERAFLLLPT